MGQASNSCWSISDQGLVYTPADDEPRLPGAMEIWSSLFGGASNFAVSPREALNHLQFSRFPAELALLVSGQAPHDIHLSLVAVSGTGRKAFAINAVDQVVIENTWFPIPIDDYTDDLRLLVENEVELNAPLTIGQLIWLQTNHQIDIRLIEEFADDVPSAIKAPDSFDVRAWGLEAELYPYQSDGVYFLKLMAEQGLGCILGDEMGLGKTIQIISLILFTKKQSKGSVLVIAPATLLENWRRELELFSPSLSVYVHIGPSRAGVASKLTAFDVVVTSYDLAVRDEPLLSSIQWELVALDEAQNIKNPSAKRTLAAKNIPRKLSVAVTGTPLENNLTDIWSLADFVLPGFLGGISEFESTFENTLDSANDLSHIVAPILLRRRVSEVAKDLPERIDIPQPMVMPEKMVEWYETVRKKAYEEHGKAGALTSLQGLRMLCTHPLIAGFESSDLVDDMPKYERLIEILLEVFENREKCLIFTSYTGMSDLLMKDLPQRFSDGYFNFIDGRVPVPTRQPIVDEFSSFSGYGALVLNPKAAGVGLNITAANHVIHYNPEWNPALEDQASARAYRRKQTLPVTIHHLFYVNSLEEIMLERLRFKRELAEGAAKGHSGDLSSADVLKALSISPV